MRIAGYQTLALFIVLPSCLYAAELRVSPGNGTISAAMEKAAPGDTLILQEGAYEDHCVIRKRLKIQGAGPDKSRIAVGEGAGISVVGVEATITDIGFQGKGELAFGINSDAPIRIERCRFTDLAHGVSLRAAPLVDVIACEFEKCNIGVRAIGGSSPTVWSCLFHDGRQGIFCMEGAAYIQHCAFLRLDEGARLLSADQPIVRNCVFEGVKSAAVMIMPRGDMALMCPSIRNNLFVHCVAVHGPKDWLANVSHNALENPPEKPIELESGEVTAADRAKFLTVQSGFSQKTDGTIHLADASALKGAGAKGGLIFKVEKPDIGPTIPWLRPGAKPPADAKLPPNRFEGPVFIANSVSEEYLAVRYWRCTVKSQSVTNDDVGREDALKVDCPDGPAERRFNIDRFFVEESLLGQ